MTMELPFLYRHPLPLHTGSVPRTISTTILHEATPKMLNGVGGNNRPKTIWMPNKYLLRRYM